MTRQARPRPPGALVISKSATWPTATGGWHEETSYMYSTCQHGTYRYVYTPRGFDKVRGRHECSPQTSMQVPCTYPTGSTSGYRSLRVGLIWSQNKARRVQATNGLVDYSRCRWQAFCRLQHPQPPQLPHRPKHHGSARLRVVGTCCIAGLLQIAKASVLLAARCIQHLSCCGAWSKTDPSQRVQGLYGSRPAAGHWMHPGGNESVQPTAKQ